MQAKQVIPCASYFIHKRQAARAMIVDIVVQ